MLQTYNKTIIKLFNQNYMYMYIMQMYITHIHAYTLLSDLIGNNNDKKY